MVKLAMTRRDFVSTGVAAAAAMGMHGTFTLAAGNPARAETTKILNGSPDMDGEYI